MENKDSILGWTIPGWVLVLGFMVFVCIDSLFGGNNLIIQSIDKALSTNGIWTALVAVLFVAAAGVPIGYLNYQIYFYLRWNSPVSRFGLLPPLIVGREQEFYAMLRDLKDKDLELGIPWRDKILNSKKDHRSAWHYFSALFSEACLSLETNGQSEAKHHYYLSTLHSLGASHVGFSIGFLLFLITKNHIGQLEGIGVFIPLLIIFITLVLLWTEDFPRKKKNHILGMPLNDLPELFLACLFFLFFTLNTDPNGYLEYLLCLSIGALIGIYWGFIKNKNYFIWLTTLFLIIISVVIRLTGVNNYLVSLNISSLLLSSLLFCSISLAFLKNRQNARDALGMLEYYQIKRYLIQRTNDSAVSSLQKTEVPRTLPPKPKTNPKGSRKLAK